ncbi:MAG: hypothetical protein WC742_13115 [Gallionellaceae bacterium]
MLFLSLLLGSCLNGSFSSDAPGTQQRLDLTTIERAATNRVTNDTMGYVFSNNIIKYDPCKDYIPVETCPDTYYVGNPVHAYSIDPISGLPTLKGVQVDTPPVNTKAIAASPSGRYLFLVTTDNLLYTFSVGFSYFTDAEFVASNMNSLNLFNALAAAGYVIGAVYSNDEIIAKLNGILQQPNLYDKLRSDNLALTETSEIHKIKSDTSSIRSKLYSDLTETEQKSIIRLNRLMLERVYPSITPVNKGGNAQHIVGSPLLLPGSYSPSINSPWSISIAQDPHGKFVYVLGAGPQLIIYARDIVTGQLTLSGTQTSSLGQLAFMPSGLVAFGSTNGSLHTFSVNRSTGFLTETGTPFSFIGWHSDVGIDFMSHPIPDPPPLPWQKSPHRNMLIDPTWKFLYLIGSSGTQLYIPPGGLECTFAGAQKGSLIYTFIVDSATGKLTQSGPPVDTTPHIMTGGTVDPKGRFVQLLNTYEYSGPLDTICAGSVAPLNLGAIYSYYVEQSSGKLISTGTLLAGGSHLFNYMYGGKGAGNVTVVKSSSLTADKSGQFVYLLNSKDMYVYNVDQANGSLTEIGSPLTGATISLMPGKYETPVTWPSVCNKNGVKDHYCSLIDSRTHSLTWAGY